MTNSMAHSRARRNPASGRAPVRRVASGFAVLLLLIGALGFVPGVTSSYPDLRLAGPGSGARLLGLFQVSVLHNVVHLVLGVAGLALARTVAGARVFLLGAGAVYLVLWLHGLAIDRRTDANVLAVDRAGSWLHLVLGVAMLASGLLAGRRGHAR
ncbi:DUF4383 domain-containing protein [Micromonospora sp. NBS 11-29]|uniref:DUF4383 domain-containing protein n=1 Tax=Micromonospora sp. NBS 11-29 TaxID=1960879 RepID=UPI0026E437D2|nr:DUF4383 domain-containing protein [Micromonospora sp. NBS 11-29]